VVDGEGRKMSKSLGNVISPQEIIKDYGADIVRLWVASSDYNEDIRISPEIISRLAEAYRKIRNTARFILSNLYDFNPAEDKVEYPALTRLDRWQLFRLQQLLKEVSRAYETFEFHRAYRLIYDFCNENLSMYYLDMLKGRLYTYAANSLERRSAQTAIYEILNVLVRLISPLLAFSAEEIWQHLPKAPAERLVTSVHLLAWPQENRLYAQADDEALGPVVALIPEVSKLLEELRSQGLVGSSFDAKIKLLTNSEIRYKYLESLEGELGEIFKVSQVEIVRGQLPAASYRPTRFADIALLATKAEGVKCLRCWNYSLGIIDKAQQLCSRCLSAMGGNKVEK
jgi:isoleucyl-tRNA synthetase